MKFDIKNLTLEEKIKLLTGNPDNTTYNANGKLKALRLHDGPNGPRRYDNVKGETLKSTCMPSFVTLANSWNLDLAYLDGITQADECIEQEIDVLLAPGVNIKRTPLNGRNFEYFSEDPILAGRMGKAYIEGVQAKGIGTSLKHYIANNREFDRLSESCEVDERTLREIYALPFEIALEAKPWTVMCSYNFLNACPVAESKYALKEILRKAFGYDGLIVSDWAAVHNSYKSILATLDLRMPYDENAENEIRRGLEKGFITEADIDERVEHVLDLIAKTYNDKKVITTTREERHEVAVKIAEEGIVLLKNEDGILPLKDGNIIVNGYLGNEPEISGGGAARVEIDYKVPNLATTLGKALPNANVTYNKNFAYRKVDWNPTYFKNLYKESYGKDAVILCVGNHYTLEHEGVDRTDIRLDKIEEDMIINMGSKYNENLIVLIYSGSAIDVTPWEQYAKAIVYVGYAGQGVHHALANILSGKVNPSGKLTETFPLNINDTFCGDETGDGTAVWYNDGVFVGYRHYDRYDLDVAYEFGYGLSYTDFEYKDLEIKKITETDYEVSYTVKNVGDMDGKEVSQLYVKDVMSMVVRPVKELKAFSKDFIKAGEEKRITIKLSKRDFAFYDVNQKDWYVENGHFEILIGASSRDIRLKASIEICLPEDEQYSTDIKAFWYIAQA